MSRKKCPRPVEFPAPTSLLAALAAHREFSRLYDNIKTFDIGISSARLRNHKFSLFTQNGAVHLTCLKQAKRIATEQDQVDAQNARA